MFNEFEVDLARRSFCESLFGVFNAANSDVDYEEWHIISHRYIYTLHTHTSLSQTTLILAYFITTSPRHHPTPSPPHPTTTSPRHHPTPSPPHPTTTSPRHHPTPSPSHPTTTSPRHHPTPSPPHPVTTPPRHHPTPPPSHPTMLLSRTNPSPTYPSSIPYFIPRPHLTPIHLNIPCLLHRISLPTASHHNFTLLDACANQHVLQR